MPQVTIITPVHNAASWIKETLACVRGQTFTDWQHCLIDDGSSDASAELIHSAAQLDPRITFLRTPSNSGPAAARNLGIRHAQGRYLAFLDADDLWLPEKIERQLAWMRKTGQEFCYHDYRHLSVDGQQVGALVHGPELLDRKRLHTQRGIGSCLTVMIDRQAIPDFRFPEMAKGMPEDFLAWLQIINQGHFGHRLGEDLARYRLSPNSRSADKWLAAWRIWKIYSREASLSWPRALFWWGQYAWNALMLARHARPTMACSRSAPYLPIDQRPADHAVDQQPIHLAGSSSGYHHRRGWSMPAGSSRPRQLVAAEPRNFGSMYVERQAGRAASDAPLMSSDEQVEAISLRA